MNTLNLKQLKVLHIAESRKQAVSYQKLQNKEYHIRCAWTKIINNAKTEQEETWQNATEQRNYYNGHRYFYLHKLNYYS